MENDQKIKKRKIKIFPIVLILIILVASSKGLAKWFEKQNAVSGIDVMLKNNLDNDANISRALSLFTEEELNELKNTSSAIEGMSLFDKLEAGLAPYDGADSDGDGLTDEDEVNIYHSSPFLASTAGDAYTDGFKIENNMDVNSYYVIPEDYTLEGNLAGNVKCFASVVGNGNAEIENITSEYASNMSNWDEYSNYDVYELISIERYTGKIELDLSTVLALNPKLNAKKINLLVSEKPTKTNVSEVEFSLDEDNNAVPEYVFSNENRYYLAVVADASKFSKNNENKPNLFSGITDQGITIKTTSTIDAYYHETMFSKKIYCMSTGNADKDEQIASEFKDYLYNDAFFIDAFGEGYYLDKYIKDAKVIFQDKPTFNLWKSFRENTSIHIPVNEATGFKNLPFDERINVLIQGSIFGTSAYLSDYTNTTITEDTVITADDVLKQFGIDLKTSNITTDDVNRVYDDNVKISDNHAKNIIDDNSDYIQSVAIDGKNIYLDEETRIAMEAMSTEDFLNLPDFGENGFEMFEKHIEELNFAYATSPTINPQIADMYNNSTMVETTDYAKDYQTINSNFGVWSDIKTAYEWYPEFKKAYPNVTENPYVSWAALLHYYQLYIIYDSPEEMEQFILGKAGCADYLYDNYKARKLQDKIVWCYDDLPTWQKLIIYKSELLFEINRVRARLGFTTYASYREYYENMRSQFYEQFEKEVIESGKTFSYATPEPEKTSYRVLSSYQKISSSKIYFKDNKSWTGYHKDDLQTTYKLISNTGEISFVTTDTPYSDISQLTVNGEKINLSEGSKEHNLIADALNIEEGINYNKRPFGRRDAFEFTNFASDYFPGGCCLGISYVTAQMYNNGVMPYKVTEGKSTMQFDLTKLKYGSSPSKYECLMTPGELYNYRNGDVFKYDITKVYDYDIDFYRMMNYYMAKQPQLQKSGDGYALSNKYGYSIDYDLIEIAESYMDKGQVVICCLDILATGHAVVLTGYENISDDTVRFYVYDCNYKRSFYTDQTTSNACYLDVTKVKNTTKTKNVHPYTFKYNYHSPNYDGSDTDNAFVMFYMLDSNGNILNDWVDGRDGMAPNCLN